MNTHFNKPTKKSKADEIGINNSTKQSNRQMILKDNTNSPKKPENGLSKKSTTDSKKPPANATMNTNNKRSAVVKKGSSNKKLSKNSKKAENNVTVTTVIYIEEIIALLSSKGVAVKDLQTKFKNKFVEWPIQDFESTQLPMLEKEKREEKASSTASNNDNYHVKVVDGKAISLTYPSEAVSMNIVSKNKIRKVLRLFFVDLKLLAKITISGKENHFVIKKKSPTI